MLEKQQSSWRVACAYVAAYLKYVATDAQPRTNLIEWLDETLSSYTLQKHLLI